MLRGDRSLLIDRRQKSGLAHRKVTVARMNRPGDRLLAKQAANRICRRVAEAWSSREGKAPFVLRSVGLRGSRRSYQQHRNRAFAQYELCIAAQREARQAPTPMRPHDDEFRSHAPGLSKDGLVHLQAGIATHPALCSHALGASARDGLGHELFARDPPVLDKLLRRGVAQDLGDEHAGVDDVEHVKCRIEAPPQGDGLIERALGNAAAVDRYKDACIHDGS